MGDVVHWETIFRIINALGCLISLWLLARAWYRQRGTWNLKTEQHWWAITGWVFLGLESAIEAVILDAEPGPRIIIQTLVVAWTIRALTIDDELRSEAPQFRKDKK